MDRGGGKGAYQVGEGCGASTTSVLRQGPHRGGVLAGGGPDTERGRVLPRYMSRGVDMEDGGGDSQLPRHRRHHPPRLSPRIPGGSRYGDCHPRGQADSAGCGLEGGSPPYNLPGPAQVLRRLGQVQVPAYPGEIWCGAQFPAPPPQIL